MSLRERFAWAALLTVVLGVVAYLGTVALGHLHILRYRQVLWTALALVLAIIIVPLIVRVVLAMRMPRGALTEQDERERLFEFKSTRIAFFVLAISLMFSTFFIVHGELSQLDIAHGVLTVIALAYIVKFGAEIRYHRRGY
jgi:fumarate reductase subunit D